MDLFIDSCGTVTGLYSDDFSLSGLGPLVIRRASHVEPDTDVQWWADLAPSGGPRIGPFPRRHDALAAERDWLTAHVLQRTPLQ